MCLCVCECVCLLCGCRAEFDTTFVKPQNARHNVTFIMQKVSKQSRQQRRRRRHCQCGPLVTFDLGLLCGQLRCANKPVIYSCDSIIYNYFRAKGGQTEIKSRICIISLRKLCAACENLQNAIVTQAAAAARQAGRQTGRQAAIGNQLVQTYLVPRPMMIDNSVVQREQ